MFLRLRLLALLLAAGPAAAAPAPEAQRAEFRAALERVDARNAPADRPALRRYLLYPYLEAARLRQALVPLGANKRDAGIEKRIRAFLARHGDAPVTTDLRHDWLQYLAERARWTEFVAGYEQTVPGPVLRCHALAARLALHDFDGLREAVLEQWLAPRAPPPACAPAFRWLDTPDRLSDAEIEARARVAAQTRQPVPAALRDLPPARQALARLWERLMAAPERTLQRFLAGEDTDGLPKSPDPGVGEAVLDAFERVARRDSGKARALYRPLRAHAALSEAQRARLQRAYALGLAYDFDEDALELFDELPEDATDPLSREWRVRAALWHGEWKLALRWLEAMPEPQRSEPRWGYWRARMLERRRRQDEARVLYEQVAREREYYAFLAAERLGRKPELRPRALPDDAAVQAQLAALPAMQRARELFAAELPALASAELRYALRERGVAQQAQAARLVAAWGWLDAAVLLLSELQLWDDLWLRFPVPHDAAIAAAAKASGVPADWIYAVLRTESLYDTRATSSAGALGLLQLRLPTAQQVARRIGQPRPQRDDLYQPAVNIALGAYYLRELHDRFGGRLVLTLAAYNAGPNRIPRWLPPETLDGDIWVENIPYNETRGYVQRALSNLVMLSWRRSGTPAALLPLLPPVPSELQDAKP